MCHFYIGLIDHSVTQSGVNLDMTSNRCTCSIGIPLSIAIVANDRLNLCG